MESLVVTETVHRQLRDNLLDENDLIDAVRQSKRAPIAGQPDRFQCICTVAVRRPLDPETAELRRLEVSCRTTEDGLEIYRVKGLDPAFEG